MKAVPSVMGDHVLTRGCFYHLTQSTWRKAREIGLTVEYKENDDVKLFCGMLDGLAFFRVDKVAEGMAIVKQAIPQTDT